MIYSNKHTFIITATVLTVLGVILPLSTKDSYGIEKNWFLENEEYLGRNKDWSLNTKRWKNMKKGRYNEDSEAEHNLDEFLDEIKEYSDEDWNIANFEPDLADSDVGSKISIQGATKRLPKHLKVKKMNESIQHNGTGAGEEKYGSKLGASPNMQSRLDRGSEEDKKNKEIMMENENFQYKKGDRVQIARVQVISKNRLKVVIKDELTNKVLLRKIISRKPPFQGSQLRTVGLIKFNKEHKSYKCGSVVDTLSRMRPQIFSNFVRKGKVSFVEKHQSFILKEIWVKTSKGNGENLQKEQTFESTSYLEFRPSSETYPIYVLHCFNNDLSEDPNQKSIFESLFLKFALAFLGYLIVAFIYKNRNFILVPSADSLRDNPDELLKDLTPVYFQEEETSISDSGSDNCGFKISLSLSM